MPKAFIDYLNERVSTSSIRVWDEQLTVMYSGDGSDLNIYDTVFSNSSETPCVAHIGIKLNFVNGEEWCEGALRSIEGAIYWHISDYGYDVKFIRPGLSDVAALEEFILRVVIIEHNPQVNLVLHLYRLNGFRILTEKYQDKIVSFFSQDRHYFIDPNDLITSMDLLVDSFKVFDSIEEVYFYVSENIVLSCVTYMTGSKNVDEFEAFMIKTSMIPDYSCHKDIAIGVLTHVFSEDDDPLEEWYLVFE
jgi:hypothetical protein